MPDAAPDNRDEGRISFFLKQQLAELARKTFFQFAALLKNAALYPPAHPFLLGSAEQLLLGIEELIAKRGEAAFTLLAGELYFGTIPIPTEENLSRALEQLARKDIGGITFQEGLKRDELVFFAYVLNRDAAAVTAEGGIAALLSKAGITHLIVHRQLPPNIAPEGERTATNAPQASARYFEAVATVKEIVQSVEQGGSFTSRRLHTLVHSLVDNVVDSPDALLSLTSIRLYDEYTFAHCVNVAVLSIAMGAFLSLDKTAIAVLGTAGLLHDVGKVHIPLDIINKPDPLTPTEWEVVKRHPEEGAMILSGMPGVHKLAMVASFEHHQQHNSHGYPARQFLPQQHTFSKIVAIADAYDALTSIRVYYRIQKPPEQAVWFLLSGRGTLFDPVLVKAFVNMVGVFPLGTLLRLDTGETGLVVHQTRDLLRPRVLLLRAFDGTEKEEVSLLGMEQGRYTRTPVATLDPEALQVDVNQYFLRN